MINSIKTIVLFGMHGFIRLIPHADLKISACVHGMALFTRSSIEKNQFFNIFCDYQLLDLPLLTYSETIDYDTNRETKDNALPPVLVSTGKL